MLSILSIVFVLSGAAGLLYESIWSRYLGLFVGHSAYAQVLVLVIFLGGMSAGAWVTARRSRQLRDPLLTYAIVEALVGAIGLAFHDLFLGITTWAYDALFPALHGGLLAVAAKWSIGALLILPQSLLLGATFPLMTAGVLRRMPGSGAGRPLAVLYAANSFGAAVGVLASGFLLLPWLGLPGTVLMAALANMLCALTVYGVVRSPWGIRTQHAVSNTPPTVEPSPEDHRVDTAVNPPTASRNLRTILLVIAFGTAVASFIYEVAWVRMLSLVLGSATHSFELMLSAFILGLAGGAWWIRGRIDRWSDRMAILVRIQIVMAVLAAVTVVGYVAMFDVMAWALGALARTESAYALFAVFRYAMCLAIMLPATICAGMTLPLITRILTDTGAGEPAIGQVYAVNTVGSIVGATLASLVFMPLLGLRLLLLSGAALDLACAYVLVWGMRGPVGPAFGHVSRRIWISLAGATVFVAGLVLATRFDPLVLGSGVFRTGRVSQGASTRVLSYRDGRTASVSVIEGGPRQGRKRSVATNGKPDASLSMIWLDTNRVASGDAILAEDEATQALLPLITLAHRPTARRAAVIGQGSGMSSHFLLASTHLEALTTIEIEPAMISASRAFYPANRRVFDDPRSQFVMDDARSVFASAPRGFDLIMSEPSNPWVSGVSGLFTEEFYARVRRTLAPGGVFGQWMHMYEMSDALMLTVLRALYAQFPAFRIYLTNSMDLLIVASVDDRLEDPDWSRIAAMPGIRHDLRTFRPITAEQIARAMVTTSQELAPLLAMPDGRNSDFYPLLDQGAERARFLGQSVQGLAGRGAVSDRFDLFAALGDRASTASLSSAGPLLIPRVLQAAVSAQVRQPLRISAADSSRSARGARDAMRRLRAFDVELQMAVPPADWGQWLDAFREVEAIWNGGAPGRADTLIFGRADAFALRHAAPPLVRLALDFDRAAETWDWAGVIAAGRPLLEDRLATGRRWIGDDRLRDVLVVAFLKSQRPADAAVVFEQLAPFSVRDPADLRSQLLAAYIRAASPR